MQKESLDFLKQLLVTPSPSGYEMGIQDLIRRRIGSYCERTTTDLHGNLIGIINPKAQTRVMLAGHCDEIGFMVMHIDDRGYLYFAAVGGIDAGVISGQRVRVHTKGGPIPGVIGRKPIHLMESEERGKTMKIHELWIDIGARDKKDAQKRVAIGDYATIDVAPIDLPNGLLTGRGFDDRAGAFVVAETLRRLKGRKLNVAVYGVSTVQEEIGLRGARTSAFGIDPHIGIAIDVGFATDYPGVDPKLIGESKMGKGVTLHRGPNINPVLEDMIEECARRRKIPCQIMAEPRATGTDANAMQIARSGAATALVSIPTRYIHTPVEVLSLEDLDNASKLLAEFIAGLKEPITLVPRVRR